MVSLVEEGIVTGVYWELILEERSNCFYSTLQTNSGNGYTCGRWWEPVLPPPQQM